MKKPELFCSADLEDFVARIGFLPYFRNRIAGFSVQELVPPDILWSEDGPWEWKGEIASNRRVAYGKFFGNRAGYISLDFYRDFINWRRFRRPLSAESRDSLGQNVAEILYEILAVNGEMLSTELKKLSGFGHTAGLQRQTDREKSRLDTGFDTRVSRLQMSGLVVISGFSHNMDRHGNPYGWGIARLSTPENHFGAAVLQTDGRTPHESFNRMFKHLQSILPYASWQQIHRLLG